MALPEPTNNATAAGPPAASTHVDAGPGASAKRPTTRQDTALSAAAECGPPPQPRRLLAPLAGRWCNIADTPPACRWDPWPTPPQPRKLTSLDLFYEGICPVSPVLRSEPERFLAMRLVPDPADGRGSHRGGQREAEHGALDRAEMVCIEQLKLG
ncbi:UNVERIFIED_CONTAM: hypothetical protein K2H54_062296 [Gekko kuhli]